MSRNVRRARRPLSLLLAGLLTHGTLFTNGMVGSVASVAAVATFALPKTAHGDEGDEAKEQSRAAFMRGVAKLKDESFDGAKTEFLEAYRLFAHPSILLNLGLSRLRLAEYVDAEQDLLKFIAEDGGAPPKEIHSARTWLAEAREHLATLRVQATPDRATVSVDKTAIATSPNALASVRVGAGPHALHVEAEGFEPFDETIEVAPKEDVVRRPVLKAKVVAPALPPPVAESTGMSGRRVAGIAVLGVGVAFLGAGIACGTEAQSLADKYNGARVQNPDDKSKGLTLRTVADIGFLAALAAGGVGTYLIITGGKKTPTATASFGPTSIQISGHF